MSPPNGKAVLGVRARIALVAVLTATILAFAFGVSALLAYRSNLAAQLDLEGEGPPPAAGNPVPAANRAKSVILFVGDSRIEAWPTPPSVADTPVVNLGRWGETTAQLLARLDDDIIGREPRLVVVQIGINDLKAMGVFRTRATEIAERCWENLTTVIARLKSHDIPVVVLTIFPVGDVPLLRYPVWSDRTLDAVAEINERLRRAKEPGLTVFDCDPFLSVDGRMREEYAIDEFHVNVDAYSALGAPLIRLLDPMLRDPGHEMDSETDAVQ